MSKIKKTREENLDEIVFAHRNKEYGAFELRKKYKEDVIKSLGFSFFLFLLFTVTPLIMAFNSKEDKNFVPVIVTGDFSKFDNPVDVPPAPSIPKNQAVNLQQLKDIAPVIVEKAEEIIEMKKIEEVKGDTSNKEFNENFTKKNEIFIEDEKPYDFDKIEEKPVFPGGDEALLLWVQKHTKFPAIARENRVTGKVCVKFVINKEGKVTNVQLLNSIDPSLDKEALRVVSEIPDWTPGKNNGRPANVSFIIPIKFSFY